MKITKISFVGALSVGFILLVLSALIIPGVYGAYLAFKASMILGVIAMVVEPSPTVLGWLAIFGHGDICNKIAQWLHLPF